MPSLMVLGSIGVVCIFILLGILLLIPESRSKQRGRWAREKKVAAEQGKDWHKACLRLEKHVHELRRELAEEKRSQRKYERELLVQREKYKKLKEKVDQQKQWQEKEQSDLNKKSQRIQELEKALREAENNFTEEHGLRLRCEREIKEIQEGMESERAKIRDLETRLAKATALAEGYREEISRLREENQKLAQKHDDRTWIAKSEYQRVEQQLKAAQREIFDLKELIRRKGIG